MSPISGLMVVCNETRHLKEALQSIRWCDEVVVVSVGTNPQTRRIAARLADRVLDHPRVQIGEEVRAWAVPQLRHDWIIVLDPDEVFPAAAIFQVQRVIEEDPHCAAITLRFKYYFYRRSLDCCMWRHTWVDRVFHRERVRFSHLVHTPPEILGPRCRLPEDDAYAVKHYWKDTLAELVESHVRYIKLEGEARYHQGSRFSWGGALRATWEMFRYNFVSTRGCFGGVPGWFLSFFMAWYEAASWFSLKRYERQVRRQCVKTEAAK